MGTEPVLTAPVFSPNGQALAYWDLPSRQLKRISISGGVPLVIADGVSNPHGVSWEEDGTILFGQPEGILRVPATGGTPELIIPTEDGSAIYGPRLLPDGFQCLREKSDILIDTDNHRDRIGRHQKYSKRCSIIGFPPMNCLRCRRSSRVSAGF